MLLEIVTVVLVVNLVAIFILLRSALSIGRKLLWTAIILLLPIVGVVFFFLLTELPSSREEGGRVRE